MKVFWSWQADTPGKIGRFLVRDALKDAIELLKADLEIDEPIREALHVDQDREGVPGSPELVRTILEKIDDSEIVVADVTLVGVTMKAVDANDKTPEKKLINSNVALELGYAFRALTSRKVLMIFNLHYGKHEELPFDLRHRGGALVYTLAPEASAKELMAVTKDLTSKLVAALKLCVQEFAVRPVPFDETPHRRNRAEYFQQGEILAQIGEPGIDQIDFKYEPATLCYLRLIPGKRLGRPLALARLNEAAQRAPLLSRQLGTVLCDLNKYGGIGFEPGPQISIGVRTFNASTQLLENGEVWSIGASLIVHQRGDRPTWLKLPFVPAVPFERVYYDTLRALVSFAAEYLELEPPWQVECGIVGTAGLHLAVPPDEVRGPIRKLEVMYRHKLKNADSQAFDDILLGFFRELHDAAGYARPETLGGFPPERPH